MQTLEGLRKRLDSAEDLQTVVKTMKSMAAVNIRQYQGAVEALADYSRTVELGLWMVVHGARDEQFDTDGPGRRVDPSKVGAIVIGTDQGMCGQLNSDVYEYAARILDDNGYDVENRWVLALGERIAGLIEDGPMNMDAYFNLPSAVSGIAPMVTNLLLHVQGWLDQHDVHSVYLFHAKPASGASSVPTAIKLMPVDMERLGQQARASGESRSLPMHTMERGELLRSLAHEYLFISVYRSVAESQAAENTARLASMQGAERNIEDRITELTADYNRTRQMTITEELLDIVSGFEALKEDDDEEAA